MPIQVDTPPRIEISPEEVLSLTTAIRNRYGLDFTNYEVKSLTRGLIRVISKHQMKSMLDLWSAVLRDKDFFHQCIDDLTVNLTEMFRNPEFWIFLRDKILIEEHFKFPVQVWHAGCATGEEVYSLGILLKEKNWLFKVRQLATDISEQAMDKAKEGRFSNQLLKKYSNSYQTFHPFGKLEKYYTPGEDTWQINDELRKRVKVQNQNLVTDPPPGKFDIIFCRNVMIYFDDSLKMKVLENFRECLKPGGWLIIGYYDMLPRPALEWFHLYDAKTRIYRKTK